MPHRRARFPSIWPIALPVGLVTGASTWLMHADTILGALAAALGAGLVGVGAMQVRVALWRRRHPVISPEEYAHDWLAAQRRAAPWN